jgi:phospholipid/cholesterol/gamma-HCH transport system substrate-binding protein
VEDKVNYTLVGVFVLALGTALVAGVLWLAAGIGGHKRYDPYQAVMNESVAGLNLNAPVKYLGVDVGKVQSIAIDTDHPQQVRVMFAIERGTPITEDTLAVLKTQGLTGIAYVELSGGRPDSPPLVAKDGSVPTIGTRPSLTARLEADVATVLAGLNRTSTAITATLDAKNREALARTLADTATLMHTLAAQQATISEGIQNTARAARNTARATEQLAPAVEQLGPAIERITQSAASVQKMADEIARTGVDARVAVDAAASGVRRFNAETLPEFDRLLAQLNQLAGSLRRLSEQTERNPSSLLLGAPTLPPGPGEKASP